MDKTCIVVIPVYKTLDIDEIMVINQAIKMTEGFKKIFIAPDSFEADESYNDFKDIQIERFDDSFFVDVQGYNRLMLNPEFYNRFSDYKYILIHQTDVYLFKDELRYWCEKGYDYIGAPWYIPQKLYKQKRYKFIFRYCKMFFSYEKLIRWRHYNNVGNGGFSLRKVSTFIDILKTVDRKILQKYIANESNFFHEDMFWSIEVPERYRKFEKPSWKEALTFSIESIPEESYIYLNNTLPFGCHAFKKTAPKFWKQFIPFRLDD